METRLTFGKPNPSVSTRHVNTLAIAFCVAFIAQSFFLPCLCRVGAAKMNFALMVDAIILLRILIAWFAKEKTVGTFYFYSVLLLSSPLWIELIFRVYGLGD